MTEQDVYEKILDCQDLLDKINNEDKIKIINGIVDRYNEYISSQQMVDITSLNNAILENKIKNTLIQILLINKINNLKLPTDYQGIYTNIPRTIIEQEKYINDLYSKYELVYKCYNLIIEIESLFESEYDIAYDSLKNSQYANLTNYINSLYKRDKNNPNYNLNYTTEMLKVYFQGLSLEEKQILYFETLSLCYNRNLFDFLNIYINCHQNLHNNSNECMHYQMYKQIIIHNMLNKLSSETPLEELYETISNIHNSPQVKKLIKNK